MRRANVSRVSRVLELGTRHPFDGRPGTVFTLSRRKEIVRSRTSRRHLSGDGFRRTEPICAMAMTPRSCSSRAWRARTRVGRFALATSLRTTGVQRHHADTGSPRLHRRSSFLHGRFRCRDRSRGDRWRGRVQGSPRRRSPVPIHRCRQRRRRCRFAGREARDRRAKAASRPLRTPRARRRKAGGRPHPHRRSRRPLRPRIRARKS